MDEDKKYSIIGRVEIGTDEYRDLIEEKHEAEKSSSMYRDKFWAEQSKVESLTKENAALKAKIAKCEKFLKSKLPEDSISIFAIFEE